MLICLEKHKSSDPTDPDVEEQLWPCPITMRAFWGGVRVFSNVLCPQLISFSCLSHGQLELWERGRSS